MNVSKEVKRVQKALNNICSIEQLEGNLFLVANLQSKTGNEQNIESNLIIDSIVAPIGFSKYENQIYNKILTVNIFCKK